MKRTLHVLCAAAAVVALLSAASSQAAPASTAAGVLIDVFDGLQSNNNYVAFGPVNVSRYSTISLLAYTPSAVSRFDAQVVRVIFTATPTTLDVTTGDLNAPGDQGTECSVSRLGTMSCIVYTTSPDGQSFLPAPQSHEIPVTGPYVSFVARVPTTVSVKLWAKP